MKRYTEKVVGNIYERGDVVEIDVPNHMIDCYGHEVTNAFSSHYQYGEEIVRYVEETGSIRGYNGPMMADAIVWDFDSSNIADVFSDVVELIDRLYSMTGDYNSIRLYFSGNKGMHVYFLSADIRAMGKSVKIPTVVKYVAMDIAQGLSTCDESIYDRTRIIRIVNSKHPKSGMYKAYIGVEDFLQMPDDERIEYPKQQREAPEDGHYTHAEYISNAIAYALNNDNEVNKPKTGRMDLLEGVYEGFSHGNRNVGLTSLAGILHSKGLSKDLVRGLLHSVNTNSDKPISDDAIDIIISSVSRYKVDDDYAEVNDNDILTMEDSMKKWEYMKRKQIIVDSGLPLMDRHLANFDPGKVMMLAARGGVGKTNLGLQMANDMARNMDDGLSLFVSLEMSAASIFYRAAMIEDNREGVYMEPGAFSERLMDDEDIKTRTLSSWKNTLIIDKSSLGLEKIEEFFNKAQAKYNNRVKILLIDYVGLINGTDDYSGMSKVAKTMKHLAKKLNTRIILLVQVSRKGGDGTTPVTLNMLRDAGTLEEAADIVLGMWLSPSNKMRIHNRFIKNRDGERDGQFDLIQRGLAYECVDFDDSEDMEVSMEKPIKW